MDKGKSLLNEENSYETDTNGLVVQTECLNIVNDDSWLCAVCRDKIQVQETAQIKGCEHAYCINCILRWASCKEVPWCPQCRLPFNTLYSYRTLEGSLSDNMVEESVCLLLRAPWFKPIPVVEEERDEFYDEDYEDFEDDMYRSTLRLANRRWGEGGFISGGRKEARPAPAKGSPSSHANRQTQRSKFGAASFTPSGPLGRRAKRAQKRDVVDGVSSSSGCNSQQNANPNRL